MRQKKQWLRPYGLRARFAISLVLSAIFCTLLFVVLHTVSDYYLTECHEGSQYANSLVQKQGESLQDFIRKNNVSSKDLSLLKKWENRQPTLLLELFSDGRCIYSSFDDIAKSELRYEAQLVNDDHMIPIQLEDIDVVAVLYSDATYQYYVVLTAVSAIIAVIVFILLFLRSTRRMIRYICRLNEEVQILEGGNLEYQVSVEGNDEITDLAKSMNRMRESFQQQMETEQELHRANIRLVTEMSHDLRTPLTGILLYLEILLSHRYQTSEELQNYLEKINAKAHHLKQMSDNLFEYSLAEKPKTKACRQNMQSAFSKCMEDFMDDLTAHGFSIAPDISWSPCFVDANEEFVHRIFENIVSNAVKYAEPKAEITICTVDTDQYCGFSIMNICAASCDQPESNGIGIESIRTMMRQMNGICTTEQTEAAFEITLLFPKQ